MSRNSLLEAGSKQVRVQLCQINLQLKRFTNFFLVAGTVANQEPKFTITDTKLYVPVVILSTQDNAKLLEQLIKGLKEQLLE